MTLPFLPNRLVTFEPVNTPTARLKILTLTIDGRAHLHQQGMQLPTRPRGGVEHEYWRHILKQHLIKAGYKVKEEYPIGDGQAVDLYAAKNSRNLYIEVETGKSNVAANLTKSRSPDGTVIFFFTDKTLGTKQKNWPTQILRLTPADIGRLPLAKNGLNT